MDRYKAYSHNWAKKALSAGATAFLKNQLEEETQSLIAMPNIAEIRNITC